METDHRSKMEERKRLRLQEQRLILMKETGPKSAAWQRARLATLWRIQQRLAVLERVEQQR